VGKGFREPRHSGRTDVIQSVDRAIRVLSALQGARRMSLSDLAARLELAPSTTHGIVRTLVQHGMVVQERGSSRYQLGPAVLRLGNVYLDTLELRSRAIPWAEDLARRTGLAVRTGVLLVDDVVIIHHEPRPDGSRQMPEVGIVIPVHASALGKAMLAFLPEDEKRVLTSGDLRSMTGETITSPDALRGQLDEIRSSGIAVEQDEAVIGESSLASPIFDSYGEAIGAIGVVIPSDGHAPRHDGRDLVREAARSVSRELGAAEWPARLTGDGQR
jgi:DNA-binding IclR family transcriptional regulator